MWVVSYAISRTTVRLRKDVARVRISDILRDAPVPVIEAAAAILLGQMYRRRVPGELRDLYRQFARSRIRPAPVACRLRQARRIAHNPRGTTHDRHSPRSISNILQDVSGVRASVGARVRGARKDSGSLPIPHSIKSL